MDAQTGVGGESSSSLRSQIQQTQLQLGAKLGALEGEVRAATSHAKDAIRERIEVVRDVVDIRRNVVRHPWMWSAIAVGVGAIFGRRIKRGRTGMAQTLEPGWARSLIAPHFATLQSMLVGRALSFVAERLTERVVSPQTGPDATTAPE